ncbi:MAG: hypothetical protein EXR95_09510 [Gemmatimonadetes bacterium]|nr:hypothetical protein [Gemmatimonadota bacterium]
MERLRLPHLNDSKSVKGSRWDWHQNIGEGTLGLEPFRRFVTEDRFAAIPKLLETPKEPDALSADRRNLATLRRLRLEGRGA